MICFEEFTRAMKGLCQERDDLSNYGPEMQFLRSPNGPHMTQGRRTRDPDVSSSFCDLSSVNLFTSVHWRTTISIELQCCCSQPLETFTYLLSTLNLTPTMIRRSFWGFEIPNKHAGKTEFLYHIPPRKSFIVSLVTEDAGRVCAAFLWGSSLFSFPCLCREMVSPRNG